MMYEPSKSQGPSGVTSTGTSSNLLASIAASPNLMNAILAQNHVENSVDSMLPSQRRYTMPMDAANAARSTFSNGSSNATANNHHIPDLSLASVDLDASAPSTKKIRRLISEQFAHDSFSTSPLPGEGLNQHLKDAINRKFSASATPNIESLLLLHRMYQQCLLSNLINPGPDVLLRMQQLNSLQQVMQSSPTVNVQPPNFFTNANTSVNGNLTVPETPSTAAAAAAAAAASLNLINATSASVIAQQRQSQTNYSPISPLVTPSQNPLLTPVINALLQNLHLSQQQQHSGNSSGLVVSPPVVTSASGLNLSSLQSQSPSVMDLCNFILQQQQHESALFAAGALNNQCQAQSHSQHLSSHNPPSVVINGQDGGGGGGGGSTIANKPGALQKSDELGVTKHSVSGIVPGRSQQLPVCRRKLEARLASIIAQELVSDEESGKDSSTSAENNCASDAMPAESEIEGKCSSDSGVSSPVLNVKKEFTIDADLNSERKYSQATSSSTSSSEEMVVDIDSPTASTTSKHSSTAAAASTEMMLKITAPTPIMITPSS